MESSWGTQEAIELVAPRDEYLDFLQEAQDLWSSTAYYNRKERYDHVRKVAAYGMLSTHQLGLVAACNDRALTKNGIAGSSTPLGTNAHPLNPSNLQSMIFLRKGFLRDKVVSKPLVRMCLESKATLNGIAYFTGIPREVLGTKSDYKLEES